MNITIKRIYDTKEPGDGYRVLVDRLWPRGISKEKASWDEWLKNIAPSTALRQWFAHDPVRWDAFRKKYDEELDGNGEAVSHLLRLARKGKVTLLYSARNTEHNEAAALRDYLLQRFASYIEAYSCTNSIRKPQMLSREPMIRQDFFSRS